MSEKRRGGAWTEVAHNDEVAWGLPREGVAQSAAPERIKDMSEKRRGGAWTEVARNDDQRRALERVS